MQRQAELAEMGTSGVDKLNRRLISTTDHAQGNRPEVQNHMSHAMELMNSLVLPMVLNTTIQLGVLQMIADAGPGAQLSTSDIASRFPANNPDASSMLDRMLRLLASYSVLTCSVVDGGDGRLHRLYGLAPVAKYFVRNQDGASLGDLMALVQDKVYLDSWYELKNCVLEGGVPFERVHGTHAFDYKGKDPRFNEIFNKAMINHTTIVIKELLESYKGFEHLTRLVDVGGGLGITLGMITSKYPSIKGINFDLPHVIRHASAYPGVEHIGGDMFVSVSSGDAIFMKWILHDWSDDQCLKLLKNCYKSLPEEGKVIVVEVVLPEIPDTGSIFRSTSEIDLMMMTQYTGGKERTKQEFLDLAKLAGFQGIRFECFVCNFWVMEFYK